jgi:hypothetical protein
VTGSAPTCLRLRALAGLVIKSLDDTKSAQNFEPERSNLFETMTTLGATLLAPSPGGHGDFSQYDGMYYLKGAAAGGICCSITHGALTPVDVVKTRIQIDSVKVRSFTYGTCTLKTMRKIKGKPRSRSTCL